MNRLPIFILLLLPHFAAPQNADDFIPQKQAYPRLLNDENAYAYYHKDWRRLEDKLINHQKRTGNQLVVVIIPSVQGNAIDDIAVQIFRSWGIGNKEANNGLLILIARKEKKIKIETGYGLESKVTDLESGDIIRNILEPDLLKYNFQLPPVRNDKGYLPALEKTIDTLMRLTAEINQIAINNAGRQKSAGKKNRGALFLICLIAVITFFLLAKAGWRLLNNKLSSKKIV